MKRLFVLAFVVLIAACSNKEFKPNADMTYPEREGTGYPMEEWVDLRNTSINGKVVQIIAPDILRLRVREPKGKGYRWYDVKIAYLDYGSLAGQSCNNPNWFKIGWRKMTKYHFVKNQKLSKACDDAKAVFKHRVVKVEVLDWDFPLYSYVYKGNKNMNFQFILDGKYGVDYRVTRDMALALMEKEARCSRKGIWEYTADIPEEKLKCLD